MTMNQSIRFALFLLVLSLTAVVGRTTAYFQASTYQPHSFEDKYIEASTDVAAESAATINQIDNNCRYGVAGQPGLMSWGETIGAGWSLSFSTNGLLSLDETYVPMIRMQETGDTYSMTPTLAEVGTLLSQYPGRMWIIGNETDTYSQDGMLPANYARAYREIHDFIKQNDPTSLVSPAGLSMATPARMQYLDMVLDAYYDETGKLMPVDAWNIHIYILAERIGDNQHADGQIAIGTDPELAFRGPLGDPNVQCPLDEYYCRAEHDNVGIFQEQIYNMRRWMRDRGYRDVPLMLSEWSQLYPYIIDFPGTPQESCFLADEFGNCFSPERTNHYMDETAAFLLTATDSDLGYPQDDNRLVQQSLWFILHADPESSGGSSSLLKENYADFPAGDERSLNTIGLNLRTHAQTALVPNFKVVSTNSVVAQAQAPSNTASVQLEAAFVNNGNTGVSDTFTVTYYRDAGLTNPIGSTTITADALGCASRLYETTVTWSNLPSGTHNYWVKVDSGNAVAESDEGSDNVMQGVVMIDPPHISYLPIMDKAFR